MNIVDSNMTVTILKSFCILSDFELNINVIVLCHIWVFNFGKPVFFSNLNKVTKDGKPFEKLVMILKFYIEHLILIPRYCRFKIKTDWVAPRNVFLYFYCWNVLISATKVRINNNNKMKRNWFEYQPFKIFEICMGRPMV